MIDPSPPLLVLRFFRWFCDPRLTGYIEGDLIEVFKKRARKVGKRKADLRFVIDVLLLFRPGIIRRIDNFGNTNNRDMFRSYFKIGWRNLAKNKGYSFINTSGLAVGMTVALFTGLWIWDEVTYNRYHQHYDRIAQVWQHTTYNGIRTSGVANPHVMAEEIRNNFGSDFKYVLQSTWNLRRVLTTGEKKFNMSGMYWEPQVIDMLSIKLLAGRADQALKDPYSIVLSESVAIAFFGDADPLGQTLRVNNSTLVKVTGVYEDLPYNSSFRDMSWIMPWELFVLESDFIKFMTNPWANNFTQTWAEIAGHADMEQLSAKITNVKYDKLTGDAEKESRPEVFLHPMSRWHLYSEFRNGQNIGGRIGLVWLFATIGTFVLLLACINFMNLSTARSERRGKEVGIRKSVGSTRFQLIGQFLSEALLVSLLAFILSVLLVQFTLPFFNQIADKRLSLPWNEPLFWMAGIGFSIMTATIAGSYPAFYLSSLRPLKVLKGTFRAGKYASLPRKALIVMQSAVSVVLVIGTVAVFKQIEFAMNRPIGYDRKGLVTIPQLTNHIHKQFEIVRQELIGSGAVLEVTETSSPITEVWDSNGGFDWRGKDPSLAVSFYNNGVTYEYGKTVGWTFKEGRDFSRDFGTDSLAFVINEAAAKFLGFERPVGEQLTWDNKSYTIIGVIHNMIIESPYAAIQPQLFHIDPTRGYVVMVRLNPAKDSQESLEKVSAVFSKYNPESPFEYHFADDVYARKFEAEMRVGKLAGSFAILAIFIGCLGVFGMAGFVAEQRTKEIGIRKVLGASVFGLWSMVSIDFVVLVIISLFVAMPLAWFLMTNWLSQFEYRTEIPWWVFVGEGASAILITLLTVSYQSVNAALANPVKSLRME